MSAAADPRAARRAVLAGIAIAIAVLGTHGHRRTPPRLSLPSAAPVALTLGLGDVVRLTIEIAPPLGR